MSNDINQRIPVYIANLAVSNLEQKIATLESKNQILRQEYTALVHERGESIKKLEDENERLKAEVEWLRKADRLVCWNPATQQWEVRYESPR